MATSQPKGSTLYWRLMRYVKPYWYAFVLASLGNILYSSVDSFSMYLLKPFMDKGYIGQDIHFLRMIPLIILGLFVLRGLGSFLSTYFMGLVGRTLVLRLRLDLFKKILVLPAYFFDSTPTGQVLSKFTYNVEQVTQASGDSLTTLVRESSFVIGLIIVMSVTSWRLTLLVFIVLPFVVLIVTYISRRFRKLSHRIQNAMGNVTQLADETITGYQEVRVFGGQARQNQRFSDITRYNFRQEMKLIVTDAISSPIIQLLAVCVLALIIYVIFHGPKPMLSPGGFVSMFSAMLAILKPIKNLSRVNATIQRGLAGAQSVFEVFDKEVEVDEGQRTLDLVKGDVRFKAVSFRYDSNQEDVIKNFDLILEAGKTYAFVGHSGGGKTTLIKLLSRFYSPRQGQVLIDGVDIQRLQLANLRSHLSLVSQHVILFDDTLFNNITFGQTSYSKEQVTQACQKAQAWGFIEKLPQGLETMIGENGLSLSGGQRQRVAIARALLKDAPILILDEATSSLDYRAEAKIQKGLEALRAGRTTLIIAHRLSTIEKADQIIVMDQGRVVESGPHADLMAKKGFYHQLQNQAEI